MDAGSDQRRETGFEQIAGQEDQSAQSERLTRLEARAPGQHGNADRIDDEDAADDRGDEPAHGAPLATAKRDQADDQSGDRKRDQVPGSRPLEYGQTACAIG